MEKKSRSKNVFIIGGTGFIGYHTLLEFRKKNYEVGIMSRDKKKCEGLIPSDISIKEADLYTCSVKKMEELLSGYDYVVFAAGADDRVLPKKPAYDFYHKANVECTEKVLQAAKKVGLKKAVVITSYFTHFTRKWKDIQLAKHHPYIRSRIAQEELCEKMSSDTFKVVVLQLPYVVGSMKGKIPMWKPLVKYVNSFLPLFYTKGGTNIVAVKNVGKAIVGSIENYDAEGRYLVGQKNMSWEEFLNNLLKPGKKKKKLITVPAILFRIPLEILEIIHNINGKESGLDPSEFIKVQCKETFFDTARAQKELDYGEYSLEEAFKETVANSLK